MPTYNPVVLKNLHVIMTEFSEVRGTEISGLPGYHLKGDPLVCVHENGIVVRLGEARARELAGSSGFTAFAGEPDRAWQDWVKYEGDILKQEPLIDEAVRFVTDQRG